MMDRLEFLKMIGLGALASRVPWKWQSGTLTERVRGEEAAHVLIDDVPHIAPDPIPPYAFYGELRWTEWPYSRFTADMNGQTVEVSMDEKHWIEVPDIARVEVQWDYHEIRSATSMSSFAHVATGHPTVKVGVPSHMRWP